MSLRLPSQTSWFPLRELQGRTAFATAYDSVRNRVVMHGGIGVAYIKLPETWESDGTTWSPRLPATVPPARGGHACAFDPIRSVTVMFGGEAATGTTKLAETWRWDGVDWRQLASASSPPARDYHAMVWDPGRNRAVLFGGRDGLTNALGDTWEWDGTSWARRTPATVPPARYGHALAYDSARGRVVMFGGAAATLLADTWEWDGSNWSQRPTTIAPSARAGHCMAFDAARGKAVLFGGITSLTLTSVSVSAETWEWNGTSWAMATPAAAPPARKSAGLVYDPRNSAVVMFGGEVPAVLVGTPFTAFADTWRWNGTSWTQLGPATPRTPPDLAVFGLAHDTRRGVVVGIVNNGQFVPPETWEWDGWQWTRRTVATPAQLYPNVIAMAFDSARGRTVVFSSTGETWEFDGNTWVGGPTSPSPAGRRLTAMVYDSTRGTCVLFGGASISPSAPLGDTWEWNGVGWTLRNPATSPPARSQHAMAFDAARGRAVVFGGVAGATVFGDTWEWDGTTWTQRSTATAPPPRTSHALVYDQGRGRTVLFGGVKSGASNPPHLDTWEWDGTTWTQGPAAGEGAGLIQASDPQGRIMAFTSARHTWFYAATLAAALTTTGTACAGTNGPPVLTAGTPFVGNAGFALDLLSARASSTCAFGLAATPAVLPLPGGCTLYLGAPIIALPTTSNAGGFASVPLPLPRDPTLYGAPVFGQGFVLDPAGPFSGIAMTAGLALTLGH